MVRLRKDRKDKILNEKRRKLFTQEAAQLQSFTLNDVVIDGAIEVFDKNSRRSHFYTLCPLFQQDPGLFRRLVSEVAANQNFTSLVSESLPDS